MNKKILLIDNFDSFTYNLYQLLYSSGDSEIIVVRNNELTKEQVLLADAIVISPGPGLPKHTNNLVVLAEQIILNKPVLGVCLGHQFLAEYFGAELVNLSKVYHGVARKAKIVGIDNIMYKEFNTSFEAGSYHSWTVNKDKDIPSLIVNARDVNNEIMSFRHRELPVWGVQYHPESILTPKGKQLVENWFSYLTKHCW